MYTQFLTPQPLTEELSFWEDTIRVSWLVRLPDLDIANVWHMPDNGAISMFTLVFRQPGDNTHRNTNWFLVDTHQERVQRFAQQHMMYMAVEPSAGTVDMLWKRRNTWYTMAEHTAYTFKIKRHHVTGRFVNAAEVRA